MGGPASHCAVDCKKWALGPRARSTTPPSQEKGPLKRRRTTATKRSARRFSCACTLKGAAQGSSSSDHPESANKNGGSRSWCFSNRLITEMVWTKRGSCISRHSNKPKRLGSRRREGERATNRGDAPSSEAVSKHLGGSAQGTDDVRPEQAWRIPAISSSLASKRRRGGSEKQTAA